jgi:ComEC/Rec2-related protein
MELSRQVYWMFQTTGTLHIFAVSGLHVVMLSLPIVFVLTMFRISRMHWVLFLAPLIVLFTVATGGQSSAVRACVMSIVFFLAPLLRRKADAFSSLALAAFLILAWAPDQLFNIGFLLSFVVVMGLIVFYPVFMAPMQKLWAPDPLAPDPGTVELRPRDRLIAVSRSIASYIGALFSASCASWLASFPLMAYFFGRVSISALVSNLAIIPISFLMMLAGCLSLVLGSFAALLADIFNHTNVALAWVMVGMTKLMASVPFGAFEVNRPRAWWVFAWYATLAVAALHLRTRPAPKNKQSAAFCQPKNPK